MRFCISGSRNLSKNLSLWPNLRPGLRPLALARSARRWRLRLEGGRWEGPAQSMGRCCFHAGVCVWRCVSVFRLARVVVSLRSPDVGTMSERVNAIGEVSERCRSKTVSDRHSSDTVSESERCSDTAPTPVSESERCSDTIPTRCRSSIGVGEVLRYGVGAGSEQNINKFTFYSAFHSAYFHISSSS